MLYAFQPLLCLKLCWHIDSRLIPVLGQMDVLVKYNHQEENLPLLVVKGVVAAYSEEIGSLVFH